MFDALVDWVQAVIGAGFTVSDGGFPATDQSKKKAYCVIRGAGGPAPDVEDRRPRYKLTLIGPERDRAAKDKIRVAVEALMLACQGETAPCGAASIRALGEPIGPSYTAEDRAWMSVDLQLTF